MEIDDKLTREELDRIVQEEGWKNKPEVAYFEPYLEPLIELHKYLFHIFLERDDYKIYDFHSLVDTYMRDSELRAKMDIGNPSALNSGINQVLHSIPLERCIPAGNVEMDRIMSNWIAAVYNLLQWKYKLSSKEISIMVPSAQMAYIYNPLHMVSLDGAAERIYEHYWEGKNNGKD